MNLLNNPKLKFLEEKIKLKYNDYTLHFEYNKKSNFVNVSFDLKNMDTNCLHEGYFPLNIKHNYTFIITIYKFNMESKEFIKFKEIYKTFDENNDIYYMNVLQSIF